MMSFAGSLLISLVASLLILRWCSRGGGWRAGVDRNLDGVQKMHQRPVPRIGGIAVFAAALLGAALVGLRDPTSARQIGLLFACAAPAFAGGLLEDFTGRVPPRSRIAWMLVSCALAGWLCGVVIPRVDIDWLAPLIAMPPAAIALTVLALLTITNAVNIIDGFNGLAGVTSAIMLLGLAIVGLRLGDVMIVSASLVIAGAIAGFLVWNYPRGLIMLGDGGAYFIGFVLASLTILLVARNAAVSAWFPVLLLAYPLVEITFTVYRRKVLRDTQPHLPDAAHLHQLIFRRVVRWAGGRGGPDTHTRRNAMTAPYLWVLSSLAVAPAVLWHDRGEVLAPLFGLFVVSYVWLYFRIARLKVPRWMVLWQR
jgi:UDP-N-acetylmuramyl pentapeptide phosphotransferase/UDP-N-acetylglucosamine-1-phosphate transferase